MIINEIVKYMNTGSINGVLESEVSDKKTLVEDG
jgi:hypothetical protein